MIFKYLVLPNIVFIQMLLSVPMSLFIDMREREKHTLVENFHPDRDYTLHSFVIPGFCPFIWNIPLVCLF